MFKKHSHSLFIIFRTSDKSADAVKRNYREIAVSSDNDNVRRMNSKVFAQPVFRFYEPVWKKTKT